jgi:hypothetical protein
MKATHWGSVIPAPAAANRTRTVIGWHPAPLSTRGGPPATTHAVEGPPAYVLTAVRF